jgi:polar amino acid transport system substrate-binding protein
MSHPRAALLAPGGVLRASVNFGNRVLAYRGTQGEPRGVSVDIAAEFAQRLGVKVSYVLYETAGKVVDGVKKNEWDIAFLAIDPLRANEIAYSAAYVQIEGAYLVQQTSPLTSNDEVDRPGNRIVAATGSAYDLHLTREIKQATLERASSSAEVVPHFLKHKFEVAAGVKQQLEADVRTYPGLRLLPGRFMQINQAAGVPKGREAGVSTLHDFIEELKATGFVAEALKRHGVAGAAVAPASMLR